MARPRRRLTHLDHAGRARMVDVSAKRVTVREAVARGVVAMQPRTLAQIAAGTLPKGDVLAVARLAGIMAAKRTAELIPLCHPLPLSHVDVSLAVDTARARVTIEGRARVEARTGGEMEALTADAEPLDAAFVRRRLDEALAVRTELLGAHLDAYRLVNGEGDRLPGVVVDRYADYVVCQFLTAGAARLASTVAAAIEDRLRPTGIFERSEGAVRTEEGLSGARGVLAGEAPPLRLTIEEYGARFVVDVLHGQKTGFYLDQRETRRCLGALAPGRRVLNGFAYTGAFAVVAARAGAREVVSVDTSRLSLGLAHATLAEDGRV